MTSIDQEIELMRSLKTTAAAIVDYVRAHGKESKFELSNSGEWTFNPDNWINIKFIHKNKTRIHVSLGVFPLTLDAQPDLEIKNGRFPNWSKISIDTVKQLPSVCRCIETAYYVSDNSYRSEHGKPKRP
jgi:hypothetical protein